MEYKHYMNTADEYVCAYIIVMFLVDFAMLALLFFSRDCCINFCHDLQY